MDNCRISILLIPGSVLPYKKFFDGFSILNKLFFFILQFIHFQLLLRFITTHQIVLHL